MRCPSIISSLGSAEEPKSLLAEVGPFLAVVIGVPVLLLVLTPRKPGESAILRRPQSWRR